MFFPSYLSFWHWVGSFLKISVFIRCTLSRNLCAVIHCNSHAFAAAIWEVVVFKCKSYYMQCEHKRNYVFVFPKVNAMFMKGSGCFSLFHLSRIQLQKFLKSHFSVHNLVNKTYLTLDMWVIHHWFYLPELT